MITILSGIRIKDIYVDPFNGKIGIDIEVIMIVRGVNVYLL